MKICEELTAGLLTGFLTSAERGSARSNLQNGGSGATSQEGARQFIVLFGALTPESAHELPPHLKATAEVAGTSPTIEDLRVQKKALALIARAIEYIASEGAFNETVTEYREG